MCLWGIVNLLAFRNRCNMWGRLPWCYANLKNITGYPWCYANSGITSRVPRDVLPTPVMFYHRWHNMMGTHHVLPPWWNITEAFPHATPACQKYTLTDNSLFFALRGNTSPCDISCDGFMLMAFLRSGYLIKFSQPNKTHTTFSECCLYLIVSFINYVFRKKVHF